jgi:hypothetical protein
MGRLFGSTRGKDMDGIRFLHIPKTAGTSFTDCLARIYRGSRFTFSGDLQLDHERFFALDPSERDSIVLVTGHSPRVTGIPQVDELPVITFLRDPVERVKSFCQHVSEGKSPDMLERFPPGKFDLDEFLACGNAQLSNLQTRMLLGEEGYNLVQDDVETLAEAALRVLAEDMACFGIVEQFNRSLMLFRRKLGWQVWPVYRRLNARGHESLLTFNQDQLVKIRQLNVLDLLVYQQARELWQESLRRHSDYVASCLVLFERRQDLWEEDSYASGASIIERVTQGWGGRLRRASLTFQTDGVKGLVREAQQYARWLGS